MSETIRILIDQYVRRLKEEKPANPNALLEHMVKQIAQLVDSCAIEIILQTGKAEGAHRIALERLIRL